MQISFLRIVVLFTWTVSASASFVFSMPKGDGAHKDISGNGSSTSTLQPTTNGSCCATKFDSENNAANLSPIVTKCLIISPTCTNGTTSKNLNDDIDLRDNSLLSYELTQASSNLLVSGSTSDSESDGCSTDSSESPSPRRNTLPLLTNISDGDSLNSHNPQRIKRRKVKKTTTTIIIKKEVKEEIICSPDDSQSSGHESFSYVTPLPSLSTPCSFAELKIPETFIPLLQPDTDFYGSSCSNPDQLLKGLIGSGKYTILLLSRHCKTQSSTFQSQVGTPVVMDMVSFQAMKVATVLLKFSAIFSGPSVRSRESSLAFLHIGHTYKSIPSAANVDIGVLQELDEQNPGELVGENIETTVNNPQIVDAFKDPSLRACSNGETGKEVMERSKKALCYIASLHPGQMIFVPCNRLFAYHTNAALNYLVKCNKITSIDDNKFYTEYFDDYFTKYVNMEHAYTTVYAIRKISDHSNQFAFIPLGNAPEPELLDSIAIYMYSQIFSADSNSPYSNKMAIAEAESILKNVKSKTIK